MDDIVDVVVGAEPAHTDMQDVVVADAPDGAEKLPKNAKLNEDGTVSLTLREPVTLQVKRDGKPVSEEVYDVLRFNRMTGADLQAIASTSDETRLAVLVGRSLRFNLAVSNKLFGKMDARDARDAGACAGFFIAGGD